MHTVGYSKGRGQLRAVRPAWSLTLAGLVVIAFSAGCRESGATQKPVVQQGTASADIPDVLATIGDEKITMADVHERVGQQIDQVEIYYRTARSTIIGATLDSIVRERILGAEAKKQGKTLDELIAATTSSVAEPTDAEIQQWFNSNQDRTGGRTLEQLKAQIHDFLRLQRQAQAVDSLRARLEREQKVSRSFQPYRIQFANEGAPFKGKENAPVTVVEFSDFQCPFCRGFTPTLKAIEKNFGDQVHIVYRQDPIPSLHPFAFKAAEASLCAQEQGKFWELHDTMFGDQTKLGVADLKQAARKLGMDGKKFDSCLDTGRNVERVQKDMAEAQRVGVKGTPAIFVNGIELRGGAVPYETVARAIQKELAQSKADR